MYSLLDLMGGDNIGLAPYGLRNSGEGVKGKGYFGLLPVKGEGVASEISMQDDIGEFPLLVPTLTKKEIDYLLSGNDPTNEIIEKAIDWANQRRGQGLSPFSNPSELRIPKGFLDYD
jgi:hypothetical protein